MMSSDDTMPFAPVREEQIEAVSDHDENNIEQQKMTEASPALVSPRVIEVKPSARVIPRQKLEIIHVIEP